MIETLKPLVCRVEPRTRPAQTRHSVEPLAVREPARVTCIDGVYELALSVRRPRSAQVRTFLKGEAEFGLVVEEPAIVVCYRIGDVIPWSLAPLEWRCPPRGESTPPSAWESRALLRISLEEGDGRPVRTSRNVTLSLDLTRAVEDAVRERERVSFDPHAETRALMALHRRLPSPRAFVSRAIARSIGWL